MTFDVTRWHRFEFENTPIYIRKDRAEWFVPNLTGDAVLKGKSTPCLNGNVDVRHFLSRLPDNPPFEYSGRTDKLPLDSLRELWFHITNRCNLSCSHCLFASSCDETAELPLEKITAIADEAGELGCRLFALTGGEPFVHKDFEKIVRHLLSFDNSHVVVLTNGMGIVNPLIRNQWDTERFHLQISVDGLEANHDRIRGEGTFVKLSKTLSELGKNGIPYTLSMCVNRQNVKDMPGLVDLAVDMGAKNVHYMWYFIRGRGDAGQFVSTDIIFEQLKHAAKQSDQHGVSIDNIEALKTQIFAPPGTIHDGTTACWESLAVGPDGKLYPSAALVGMKDLAVDPDGGLEEAWQKHPVMETFRNASVAGLPHPLRYLLGGGDADHSYSHKKTMMGDDPYESLYEKMALWLISREAAKQRETSFPELKLKMGDILESCGAHGSISLVHSNCLLSVAQKNSLSVVKEFYSEAVGDTREDILNPVCYADDLIAHIPEKFRFRGYGCGSPVVDAHIEQGEDVVDLGCGGGVECFIASKLTGKTGSVVGIDMLDPMLALANEGLRGVSKRLGYANVEFKKGYLEALPLEDNRADVVLSNCVMNLSVNKRRAYAEIFRILKPGGRLMISDVVCDTEPDAAIRNDEILRGECIAGAMTQKDLLGILSESGFESIYLVKRFPYRTIAGHPFYSLTYEARKPVVSETVQVMYRGPLKSVVLFDDLVLHPGIQYGIPRTQADWMGEGVFILNDDGAVTNFAMENTCSCALPPEASADCCAPSESQPAFQILPQAPLNREILMPEKMDSGCMKCGAPLIYTGEDKVYACSYCKEESATHVVCENGHFVCDACHSEEGLPVIEHICLTTKETDMIALLKEIRKHPAVPVNGPEHHFMVPGIILATYKNLGGTITAQDILKGIKRGVQVPGGYCGFMGVCGAAVGVGIAFALILESNPIKPVERKIVQGVTGAVLMDIAAYEAARCCQRDSWIALKKAAELSKKYLPLPIEAKEHLSCRQQGKNKECIKDACPLWPAKKD